MASGVEKKWASHIMVTQLLKSEEVLSFIPCGQHPATCRGDEDSIRGSEEKTAAGLPPLPAKTKAAGWNNSAEPKEGGYTLENERLLVHLNITCFEKGKSSEPNLHDFGFHVKFPGGVWYWWSKRWNLFFSFPFWLLLPPHPETVANEGLRGSPTKDIIDLVVTVTRWRVDSKILLPDTFTKACCWVKQPKNWLQFPLKSSLKHSWRVFKPTKPFQVAADFTGFATIKDNQKPFFSNVLSNMWSLGEDLHPALMLHWETSFQVAARRFPPASGPRSV